MSATVDRIYVCSACGKRSLDREGRRVLDRGYDESCFVNAVLCYYPPVMKDGVPQWVAVEEGSRAEG